MGNRLQKQCRYFVYSISFLFLASFEESVECVNPGAFITVLFLWRRAHLCFSKSVPLLCLLKLSGGRCTRATQALLQHMSICRLYPLVVILFCFNDLKAKFLVKVNG